MNSELCTTDASPAVRNSGHNGLIATSGISVRLGNGFQTKPIAERCGLRLSTAYPALATRLGPSGSKKL